MIPDDIKATIRSRVDLAAVIRESGVPLRRSGDGWRGPCPFEDAQHDARRFASKFSVRDDRYHCFACQTTGDIFTWIARRDRVSFQDAVMSAAALGGVPLSPPGAGVRVHAETAAQLEILARLAALSRDKAQQRSVSECTLAGIDCTAAIRSGELGMLPRASDLRGALRELSVASDDRLAALGLRDGGRRFANQWVVWATARGHVHGPVIGGRLLGASGPVIGIRGAASLGWVTGSTVPGSRVGLITTDDLTYLTLRSRGADDIALPLSLSTLANPRGLPGLGDRVRPPMLIVTPTATGRRRALRAAASLLPWSPYLRAAECPPREMLTTDASEWMASYIRVRRRGGHVLDWQMDLLRAECDLSTDAEHAHVRRQLSVLVAAIPMMFRPFYADQVERMMGLALDPAIVALAANGALEIEPGRPVHPRAS